MFSFGIKKVTGISVAHTGDQLVDVMFKSFGHEFCVDSCGEFWLLHQPEGDLFPEVHNGVILILRCLIQDHAEAGVMQEIFARLKKLIFLVSKNQTEINQK